MVLLSVVLLLIVIALATCYFLTLRKRYQYFSDRGIPTPPYDFFFGHLKTLWKVPIMHRQLETWTKEYGKVYGIYEGSVPALVISDPDVIYEIFVKQYPSFHGRRYNPFFGRSRSLFTSWGAQWRRHRQVINPTFSSAKLKLMSPLINGCITNAMEKISEEAQAGKEFNIYLHYKKMTMDIICRCAFGIDTDVQNNPENIYFKKIGSIFTGGARLNNFFIFCQLVPELTFTASKMFATLSDIRAFLNMRVLPLLTNKQLFEMPNMWLIKRLHPIIEQREKAPTSRVDFLQLVMQAMTDQPVNDDVREENKKDLRLTRMEVLSNMLTFMSAGYETTATALAYSTYAIANHPDVQEKLQAEIDQLELADEDGAEDDSKAYPDYDVVARMSYMDMFVSEVLRMYPLASQAVNRRAFEDTEVKGIKISKDTIIYADMYTMHFDPELWGPEDPHEFVPERHQTKRHPMASLAFGAGPKQCVGIRFALIEMKIMLVRLLRQYTIYPGERLESKFHIRETPVIAPEEVWVKLEKRSV